MSNFFIGDKVITTKQGVWYEPGEVFTLKERYISEWSTGWFVKEKDDSHFVHEEDIELYPKSLLTNGRRVKLRNGNMYTVVDGALIRPADTELKLSWVSINGLGKDLLAVKPKDPNLDVMEVYEKPKLVVEYFEYYAPTEVIWQREEKTAKQLQLEELQKKAQDVADAIKKLQDEE